MKLTFIKSACVLIEHQKIKVLCDPWLSDGIYYGSWYHYPPLQVQPEDFFDVNYIYISHIHPDHMDKFTLEKFPKSIPILIHDYKEKYLKNILQRIGFTSIIEVPHKTPYFLSDEFSIEILAADNCDPTLCSKFFGCPISMNDGKTLQIDSLAVFHADNQTIVNTNDCQYELAKGVCDYIVTKFEKIDLLLTGYSSATAYPQCFENLSTEEKLKEKFRIRDQFLRKAASYAKHLNARWFLPFAGQYVLGGRLHILNKFRSPPYLEETPHLFSNILKEMNLSTQLLVLNSTKDFDLKDPKVSEYIPDSPLSRENYIKNNLSQKKYIYESEPYISFPKIDLFDRLQLAHEKMRHQQDILGYSSEWSVYIDVGFDFLYKIPFNKQNIEKVSPENLILPYVKIKLDYYLLLMILNKEAHWNNAEIGSHLTFNRNPEKYEVGVFRFLSFLHN